MAELAIKGHPTRGKEVIKILEMLGGVNKHQIDAIRQNYVYFIDMDNTIRLLQINQLLLEQYIVYSLEEFEEKYPYKVGDKVILNPHPCVITSAIWDSTYNEILYYVKGNYFHVMTDANSLQSFEEETMKENNIPTIQDQTTVETMKKYKNSKSEDISEDLFDEVCKTAFGDISYKASEQTCDTYNKIKNSKFRNDRIFQMALALAPTFAREGLNLQQRLINNGCDVSSCTVGDKDILHAYGESLKLWATAFVDELNNNTK